MPINWHRPQHRKKARCILWKWMSCTLLSGEKNRWFITTFVERDSSCIIGFLVSQRRDEATLQALVDQSPQAHWYYCDLMASDKKLLYYPVEHTPMPN